MTPALSMTASEYTRHWPAPQSYDPTMLLSSFSREFRNMRTAHSTLCMHISVRTYLPLAHAAA